MHDQVHVHGTNAVRLRGSHSADLNHPALQSLRSRLRLHCQWHSGRGLVVARQAIICIFVNFAALTVRTSAFISGFARKGHTALMPDARS